MVVSGAVATLLLALASVFVVARTRTLLVALSAAETQAVPELIRQLGPYRPLVAGSLRAVVRDKVADPGARLNAALALGPGDPASEAHLSRWLLRPETPPDALLQILRVLERSRRSEALSADLHAALERGGVEGPLDERQLRAAAGIAWIDPESPAWRLLAGGVAGALVEQNVEEVGRWREVFQPVAERLEVPLCEIHGDLTRADSQRRLAYRILFSFAEREDAGHAVRGLVALIDAAEPDQGREIITRLRRDGEVAIREFESRLEKIDAFDYEESRRMGRVVTAMLLLGGDLGKYANFSHLFALPRMGDPSFRTELIHDLARLAPQPEVILSRLVEQLESEPPDPATRRAMILALGEFPGEMVPGKMSSRIEDWYRNDPDRGVHGASDWFLREQMGLGPALDENDRLLAGTGIPDERDWYVNVEGQTLSILRGPTTFLMGSTRESDGAERHIDEDQHDVRIPRTFAIVVKEVTVSEYRRFLDRNPEIHDPLNDPDRREMSSSPECPIVGVSWYDATRYCNWLSEREGLDKAQWCYPEEAGPGMTMPPDYLHRTGYRLPTEAEWEYACRGGSVASRPFGGSREMLEHFAWYQENSGGTLHRVGRKKPNDFGLFDTLGNAYEWTQDPFHDYDTAGSVVDVEGPTTASSIRALRGGSIIADGTLLRSAYRDYFPPGDRDRICGFRIVRTLHTFD